MILPYRGTTKSKILGAQFFFFTKEQKKLKKFLEAQKKKLGAHFLFFPFKRAPKKHLRYQNYQNINIYIYIYSIWTHTFNSIGA